MKTFNELNLSCLSNYFESTGISADAFRQAYDELSSAIMDNTANIYSMNNARPLNKFKLNSITLNDIYAAKDVALLMMEKDSILIVNFSPLRAPQSPYAG